LGRLRVGNVKIQLLGTGEFVDEAELENSPASVCIKCGKPYRFALSLQVGLCSEHWKELNEKVLKLKRNKHPNYYRKRSETIMKRLGNNPDEVLRLLQ